MNIADHQVVRDYLDELDRMLQGLDPVQRTEVVDGVREHIDASLADRPDARDEDVRAVLADLGPASAVAEEAYAARPDAAPATPPQRVPVLARGWVPRVVGVGTGVVLVLTFLALSMTHGGLSESGGCSGGVCETSVDYSASLPSAVAVLLAVSWLWLPLVALATSTELWTPREKVILVVLVPGAVVAVLGLSDLGWALTHAEVGPTVGAWTGTALGFVGGGIALRRLTSRAGDRVPAS